MKGNSGVPHSFRRDSRLFLFVALLLILFVNLVTLRMIATATAWGSAETERRAAEILRRLSLSSGDPTEALARVAMERDVVFAAYYDASGRRVRGSGGDFEPPASLAGKRPESGRITTEWKREPPLLVSVFAVSGGFFAVGLDPGPGSALRASARTLNVLLPAAGAGLVVLAWLYLRSLLSPYDRLLAAAGSAPKARAGEAQPLDERDFVIARFEATIAALSEKEKELERLARRQKERADDLEIAAHTLARNLPTGLLSVDREGTVVELNGSGREILGISGDIRGESCDKALAEVSALAEVVASILATRVPVSRREIRWRRGDEQRVVGITATPAVGGDGRFLGVLALFSDLSEVRRLEARVALARRLADLGKVSAGAAHEFRNAAAAIDGFADLAQRHPERAAEHLKAIRREAQEMSRVTNDFLLFARPEGFPPEQISLADVAESAAAEVEAAFAGLKVSRSGEFPEVSGSTVLLRRAVVNLIRNAAEATPSDRLREPDSVSLTGRAGLREAVISVGDRGAGVSASEREKVFLPFYSTKPDGVGFGLAIVARIAELHGGTVDVVDRPGGGALFSIRLPSPGVTKTV